ncbi:RNA dependent RNA polymerase-domain-containing protein [Lactarius pseudohatsudake]|nr:RNA dependent RNA polymerase-domain-containing protein [Lactarius pseudohatsudake]
MVLSPLGSNVHFASERPLGATFHSNGSVISLDSSDSERDDDSPGSSGYDTTQDETISDVAATSTPGPQQPRQDASCNRASGSQRPLVPLNMPDIFSSLTVSESRVASHSRNGGREQVIHLGPRKSGTSGQTPQPESSSARGHWRITPSTTDTSRFTENPEQPPPSPTPHRTTPSMSPRFSPPAPLPSPPPVQGKLRSPLEIICHSQNVQRLMERRRISWGVQYELARGVLAERWKWEDVTDGVLESLQGSNAVAAPRVRSVMAGAMGQGNTGHHGDFGVTTRELWDEYDREQEAILERRSRGLGLMGEWKGIRDWYGGRIQQVVRLSKSNGTFRYRLDQPGMQRSNRFARFLGSRRILQVKLSKDLQFSKDSGIPEHLGSRFLFCGRVFAPFAAKDSSVYMMELNEDVDRNVDHHQGDDTRISLWDFIEWHNPLSKNMNQPMGKWLARFDLGLSTSVPVLRFEPDNIQFIPDIEAKLEDDQEKVPSEKIFTDGCGFINGAALTLIARHLVLASRPTAVQGRVAGSKGLWILCPRDRSSTEPPRIWIRNSQKKVKLNSLEKDSAHVIFDLVAQSNNITFPSRLNKQLIVNLAENGVNTRVFEELLREGLGEIFASVTRWDGAGAMPLLWTNVNSLGGVSRSRLQKVARGLARAIGLAKRFDMDRKDADDDDGDDDDDGPDAEAEFKTLHQTVLELIQAGFNPKSSRYLYEKMREVLKQAMELFLKKYHIEVPQSAEAFVVPDPLGVLEEGQIQFKSSQELKDPLTETNVCCIRGPVLVSRNPTMMASDIQKVEAIEHELLADYTNVVVFSTKGSRSLASFLAGGDYDGDTVMVNWAPSIVGKYTNPEFIDKPDDFEKKNFEGTVERVKSFVDRLSQPTSHGDHKFFLEAMLQGLGNSKVGKYSKYHDIATYTKGYSDPETIRLAYMFTTCLDSRKTGLRVLGKVFEQDSKKYGWSLPNCLRIDEEVGESQNFVPKRGGALRPFILDELQDFGKSVKDEFLAKYERPDGQLAAEPLFTDRHLLRPHQQISEKLSEMQSLPRVKVDDFLAEARRELVAVEEHVKAMKKEWPNVFRATKEREPAAKKGSKPSQNNKFDVLRRGFALGPDVPHLALLGDVPAIRASYAYSLCSPSNANFAFAMAFEELCNIKARELGGATIDREFAELMSIPKSAVRTLSVLRASMA